MTCKERRTSGQVAWKDNTAQTGARHTSDLTLARQLNGIWNALVRVCWWENNLLQTASGSAAVVWSLVTLGKRSRAAERWEYVTRAHGRVCDAHSQTVDLYLTTHGGQGDGLARERPCVTVRVPRALPVCLTPPRPFTSCSGESCSMSPWRHLRPGRKWLTITSSEMTAEGKSRSWRLLMQDIDALRE